MVYAMYVYDAVLVLVAVELCVPRLYGCDLCVPRLRIRVRTSTRTGMDVRIRCSTRTRTRSSRAMLVYSMYVYSRR